MPEAELSDKELTEFLEEIRDKIEVLGYDDIMREEKIRELNTLKLGDSPVWVLDQAIERLDN